MRHRHGNRLQLVSASVPVAVILVTGSYWQRSVLFVRAVCCCHRNLLSEIHYSRIEIIGIVFSGYPTEM